MKTLSIIVPIYNVENYLEECLNSIVGVDDIEIILVNDASPDNSIEIAKNYVSKYNNIKLISHEINRGLGAARNTGIENATGKYIMFLDSDDYLDTSKLLPLLKTLANVKWDQIIVSFLRFNKSAGVWKESNVKFFSKNNNKILSNSSFKSMINLINISPIRILKREKILQEGIRFPKGLYEDVFWSYWFAYSCDTTLVVDNRIYFYRQHEKSILGSQSTQHNDLFEQQERTIELFKSHNVPVDILRKVQSQFIKHIKHILLNTDRLPDVTRNIFCKELIKSIDTFNKQDILDNEIENLISVNAFIQPIKKYKMYKKLIRTYFIIKGK